MKFVPLVADTGGAYVTETNYIRYDFVSHNQFKIWRSPLDTGGRNHAPDYFTAIAVGF